ncbi:toxin YdaT family protein [Cronobacter malonaticus]|uniref:toxin YdaT family protein n=1 Tax=Cronobacter TaxID=413496 RepID=UPI000A12220E|nr:MULTISPECIES: toxin YdaT family protein [Cronobacter]ELY6202323.1 Rha family transcriptional regulator [Cronobacter malonaticus]ELY6256198.1 Rha family transcriptional regulator [Cronobacter malonaticus]NCG99799.1 Rha family transcriptional regulator [Cronobacter malonaticus]NCH50145.1 Rha family transcriptional regulator [Cronobacter malonaticus]
MKIRHEHVREALKAWAIAAGAEKTPTAEIVDAYFRLGLSSPRLYGNEHPEALGRNTQKIFRWVKSDGKAARENIQALLPAIEAAMPPLLLARMRSHSSEYHRELVERRERLVKDVDDFVASAIAVYNLTNRGGPAGNAVAVH